jgi:hypothetical protein
MSGLKKLPAAEYVPAEHAMQLDATAAEYFPAEHAMQLDATVWMEYVPAVQDEQLEEPTVLAYVPAEHKVHSAAPFCEKTCNSMKWAPVLRLFLLDCHRIHCAGIFFTRILTPSDVETGQLLRQ